MFITLPYFHLIRWHAPAGTLLLMWSPLWCLALLSEGLPALDLLLAFVLGAFFMRSAGCIINDMTDRKLDAQVERTKNRPLASGALTIKQAAMMLALMLLGALGVAIYLGWPVLLAALPALPLVAAYPWMKRITFWPQLFLGITFNYGVLLASIALTGEIQPEAWWLYAACIFWTLGYDTIYGFQDISDDEKIGIKSTARLFKNHATLAVGFMYFLSFVCMFAAAQDMLIAQLVFLLHLTWQVIRLKPHQPQQCMMLFKQNANVLGTLVFLALLSLHGY